ncbi:DUF397 domain-containing protein [Streptomyces malaysiensis]|uniref:DUF397 domain-containing protein n=1 Tax=Streptomyces autolyticus TaxID=75293 RepID=A0ABM6HLA1_9ACTN|nr:hypothetical protein BV401_34930 [Streptomyces autolyticus]
MVIEEVSHQRPTSLRAGHLRTYGSPCRRGPVHVRDSKAVTGPALTMDRTAWVAFIGFAACDDSEGWPPHASADRLSLEVRFLTPWIPKWE